MRLLVRRTLLYYLPLACNLALIAYVVLQLHFVSGYDRHSKFFIFSTLYAVGGMLVAVSAVTAFFHATAQAKGPRIHYMLSLVNTIIPTVLLVILLNVM